MMEFSGLTEMLYILTGELVTQGWTFIQIFPPDLGEFVERKNPSQWSACPAGGTGAQAHDPY